MSNVIGVRFRTAGKMYWFSPGEYEIRRGDPVIVETSRGKEFGTVVVPPHEVDDKRIVQPVREIVRPANRIDIEQEMSNREKEREALIKCRRKAREHGLEMKLIMAEYTFDNSKILFYFTADGRVDFRELVRDLASEFKTRIELRQVGVRDEAKMIGGYGICGRTLCCHAYLPDFAPVSIKMAKEQNLSLNPTKISGSCGRLMCCLNNEEAVYEEINKRMPGVGDTATAPDGSSGEVISVNVLRETARIVVEVGDEREVREFPASELEFVKSNHRRRKKPKLDLTRRPDQAAAKVQAIKNAREQAIQAAMERQQEEQSEKSRVENKRSDNRRRGRGRRDDDGKQTDGNRPKNNEAAGRQEGSKKSGASGNRPNRNRGEQGNPNRAEGGGQQKGAAGSGEHRNSRNRNRRRSNRPHGREGNATGQGQSSGENPSGAGGPAE
ncbi:MAG: stage 0 sporulation family protein [Lachnospiraceae bacterium]|nr:stage 0 sporulation family protein [Lachnospiraceae bacterium]